jgi:hypothetical protein
MSPQPGPELLYHYTTPAGFLGIIESKTIWATGVRHLNDSQEVVRAIEIAKDLLPEFESDHPAVPLTRDLRENELEQGLRRIFVASLTEDGEQLSQWRGYGGGAAAYSVGFDRLALQDEANASEWGVLRRCIYEPDEQREYLHTGLKNMISQAVEGRFGDPFRERYDPPTPGSAEAFAWGQLYAGLLGSAAFMKHKGFAEEQEWRLVTSLHASEEVQHRALAHGIAPYIAMPLPRSDGQLDLRETIIGSTAEQPRAYEAVHSVYVKAHLLRPNMAETLIGEVRHSEIPFRYW